MSIREATAGTKPWNPISTAASANDVGLPRMVGMVGYDGCWVIDVGCEFGEQQQKVCVR